MTGVKVVTETTKKDINLLKDADPQFVSLVRHGANRMPFRVVKNEKGGDNKTMALAIQSILLPKGVNLGDLTTRPELQYLSEAKTEKQEFNDYDKYEQIPVSDFDEKSLQMLPVGGAWILVGKLDKENDNALSISTEEVQKLAELPLAPMDSFVGEGLAAQNAAIAVSFRELFDRELTSMLDVVYGSLKQSTADPKKRKNSILSAVDAFKSFISMGLDAIGDSAAKLEKDEDSSTDDSSDNDNQGGAEMFKTKEEFAEAVSTVIDDKLTTFADKFGLKEPDADDQANKDDQDTQAADDQTTDQADKSDGKLDKVLAAVTDLSEKVETVTKRQDELDQQLDTDRNSSDDSDADDTQKDDSTDDNQDTGKKPSVFSGLLTRKAS